MSIEAHTNKLAWDGPYDPSDPDPLGKVEESQGENPGVAPNSSAYNTNPDLQDVRNFHQASSLAGLGAAMSPLLATGGLLSSLPFYSRIPLQALSLGSSTSGSVLPAANSISQVSRSIGNAAEAAKDNIEKADPRLVPLLQTGSLGAMALAGIGAGTHGLANSPETQARLGYKAIAPLLPTPVRLAKHFSRYSPQMTGSYNVAVEAPFLLRKVRSMVNDGTMSEEEASKILKDFVNNTSIEMEQAGNRSLTEDSKRFSKSMNQAVQGVNSITNDEALGTQSAHYLARQAAKGVVPWPYKALTYIPTEKFMPAVRDIYGHITGSKKVEPKPYLEGSYDPLHEAVLEATKGKGAENFYSREVAPLFEEYEKAPYSDKPRILNSIVNSVGSKMGLPAQEIQADIADKGVDAVASKLKNTLQNKSRLNQYVPGYEEAGSAAIAANTAQSAANTGRIMASVAEAPLKGLRYTQQSVDSIANKYSRSDLLNIIARQNPDSWKYESFQKAFQAMDTESLKRAAGVLPPSGGKIDTTIANDLRANPNESMKRDVGIPMLLDRDGINYALESNQNIADTAEKARAAHKVTTNARSKIVDSTNRYRDSIDSQVNKAQPIVDSTVNTKALPAIDSAASRIKSTLRSKIQPSSVSNQTSNPTPTPTPTPNIVPQVKSRTPRISVPKPVPQPKPIQQPRPVTQLAKQGSDMLSYKLGALKAIKNFSKQANIPVSAVLKLAPQILNPANIEKAKQLLSPKSAKKFAPGLLGLETANIVSKAHAEQLAKAKSALGLVKSPTTVEELLAQHTANQKALEGLNQEMADNPTMSAILKHQFEEKLKTTSPEINTSIINYMQNKGIGKLLEESVLANPMSGIKSIFNL